MQITFTLDGWKPDAEGLDTEFLEGLRQLAALGLEVEIFRRGSQGTNYTLHGVILGVAADGGVQIRRTRTHEGEVHTMSSRYMFRVSAPGGPVIGNRTALAREIAYLKQRSERENVLQHAARERAFTPPAPQNATRIVQTSMNQGPGFVFALESAAGVKATVMASTTAAAEKTLRGLDHFMPLDDLVPIALEAGFVWPRSWNREWSVPNEEIGRTTWREEPKLSAFMAWVRSLPEGMYPALLPLIRGTPLASVLKSISPDVREFMEGTGLLEELPAPPTEIALDYLYLANLRKLVAQLPVQIKARASRPLRDHILQHLTPEVEQQIHALSARQRHDFKPPAGISTIELQALEHDYYFMLHALRKWLHFEEDISTPVND